MRKRWSSLDGIEGQPYFLVMNFQATILSDADKELANTCPRGKSILNELNQPNVFFSPFRNRMEAVFAWCKGAKFIDVQKLTGTFEGTTIRTLRRLEELVRQLSSAAKAIGNHELQTKFERGSELLKRDIVFCSSLYL